MDVFRALSFIYQTTKKQDSKYSASIRLHPKTGQLVVCHRDEIAHSGAASFEKFKPRLGSSKKSIVLTTCSMTLSLIPASTVTQEHVSLFDYDRLMQHSSYFAFPFPSFAISISTPASTSLFNCL
jgi:hypothetical protein